MAKLPQSLDGATCIDLVERWRISSDLAVKLLMLQGRWSWRFPGVGSLRIISGFRTAEEQAELRAEGRPAAPDHLSTHRACPATGADLDFPMAMGPYEKAELGELVRGTGLRWGGGSPLDEHGHPTDWQHVDLGPRGR